MTDPWETDPDAPIVVRTNRQPEYAPTPPPDDTIILIPSASQPPPAQQLVFTLEEYEAQQLTLMGPLAAPGPRADASQRVNEESNTSIFARAADAVKSEVTDSEEARALQSGLQGIVRYGLTELAEEGRSNLEHEIASRPYWETQDFRPEGERFPIQGQEPIERGFKLSFTEDGPRLNLIFSRNAELRIGPDGDVKARLRVENPVDLGPDRVPLRFDLPNPLRFFGSLFGR